MNLNKVVFGALFALVTFKNASAQTGLPSINQAYVTSLTSESFYQPIENQTQVKKIFYFVPQATVLEQFDTKKVFGFTINHAGESTVNFRLKFAASPTLEANRPAVIAELAQAFSFDPSAVEIRPITLIKSNFDTFADDEMFLKKTTPPKNFLSSAGMNFGLKLSKAGTVWFRNSIVKNKQSFGTVTTTARFVDEVSGNEVSEVELTLPVTLDEVPLCAVTPVGCSFDW